MKDLIDARFQLAVIDALIAWLEDYGPDSPSGRPGAPPGADDASAGGEHWPAVQGASTGFFLAPSE